MTPERPPPFVRVPLYLSDDDVRAMLAGAGAACSTARRRLAKEFGGRCFAVSVNLPRFLFFLRYPDSSTTIRCSSSAHGFCVSGTNLRRPFKDWDRKEQYLSRVMSRAPGSDMVLSKTTCFFPSTLPPSIRSPSVPMSGSLLFRGGPHRYHNPLAQVGIRFFHFILFVDPGLPEAPLPIPGVYTLPPFYDCASVNESSMSPSQRRALRLSPNVSFPILHAIVKNGCICQFVREDTGVAHPLRSPSPPPWLTNSQSGPLVAGAVFPPIFHEILFTTRSVDHVSLGIVQTEEESFSFSPESDPLAKSYSSYVGLSTGGRGVPPGGCFPPSKA